MLNNFGLFTNETNQCVLENKYYQILPIIAFLIGFIVFKFVFYENTSNTQGELKAKQSQEYLSRYQKENEEFFFGG
jgi:hypothetical protein